MTDELKILATAAVASFFTVAVVEPVKAWLQRRRVRRWLYREIIHNCTILLNWKYSAKAHPEMQQHTAAQFAGEYKKLAYDLAIKDAAFYALPNEEPYRIEKIYRDFERIAQGAYDAHDCFARAEVAAVAMLIALKDRSLSKRVAFSVSTKHQKHYFKKNLPTFPYVNYEDPPSRQEKFLRRCDAFRYWLWRKF
jgi:hypothetical protein